MNIIIRRARLDDAPRLSEIYAHYVLSTAVSFEYRPPTPEEFAARMEQAMARYPYLVAELDGKAVGYVYAHQLGTREAYKYSVELSIYLERETRRLGIGRMLYEKMEQALRTQGIISLYAVVARPSDEPDPYLTRASLDFHSAMGYTESGVCPRCGYKFGRWYDTVWMRKIITAHPSQPGELLSPEEVCRLLDIQ